MRRANRKPPAATLGSTLPGLECPGFSNVVLWAAFATVSMAAGFWFLAGIHRLLSVDALLGVVALVLRTAGFVALGCFLEAMWLRPVGNRWLAGPRRRLVLHGFWIVIMVITVGIGLDIFVFAFVGYHLTTALRILLADGPAGLGTVIDAVGLPIGRVLIGLVALAAGVAAAVFLSRKTEMLSARWRCSISRRAAGKTCLVTLGLLALHDLAGFQLRNPFLWELENRRVPLAFSIARPEAALASFRVSLKPPAPLPPRSSRGRSGALPDIYIVVIESLRSDVLTPEIMPNFSRFASEAWTFEHPITTGNVTHYAWYGLLCARSPVYFDVAKHDARMHGSVPLATLRDLGYQLHLLATPDTAYQQLESIVFGTRGELLTNKFHPSGSTPPTRDRMVVDALVKRIHTVPAGGHFHLVALDSTHFDYGWEPGFVPPFHPYAKNVSVLTNYHTNPAARQLIANRYKNSAAWVDSQLGRFLDALREAGRLKNSIVIITGDHGEAFWEHGTGAHGSDLGVEQLKVAFAMRFPGTIAAHHKTVFSLLDVMPTVLDRLGVPPTPAAGLAGRPFHPPSPDHPPASGHAITFQGWNERAFRFILTDGSKRVLLELDNRDPATCRRLSVKDVTLDNETTSLTEQGSAAAYQAMLADLPRLIERLDFLDFR